MKSYSEHLNFKIINNYNQIEISEIIWKILIVKMRNIKSFLSHKTKIFLFQKLEIIYKQRIIYFLVNVFSATPYNWYWNNLKKEIKISLNFFVSKLYARLRRYYYPHLKSSFSSVGLQQNRNWGKLGPDHNYFWIMP